MQSDSRFSSGAAISTDARVSQSGFRIHAKGVTLDDVILGAPQHGKGHSQRDTAWAMSEEKVEVVKTLFAAFADRDFGAAAKVLDPSLEIRPGIVGGPEGVVYHGLEGMRQFWTEVDAAWAEFRITPEEFRELDGEILVLGRTFARGRGSGITLEAPAAWIAGLRNRRIVDFQSFSSQHEALEAAGLRE